MNNITIIRSIKRNETLETLSLNLGWERLGHFSIFGG